MTTAATLIAVVQWYCLIGAMVALAFLLIGIDRIDEDARGAYVFRPLLIPAILLIWPLVVWRWWVLETGRDRWEGKYTPPRASHGVAAFGMAAFIVLALMASFAIRQTWPAGFDPVQLEAPSQ